jgi:type I restriction enzyme S subunit
MIYRKMPENNNIPKHWEIKKLSEVCEIIMGQSPPSTTYNSHGVGLPFFQGKAEFTELYPVVEKWCNAPNKIALPNDILLSVRAPVGTTNIANQKCCIGRGLAAIRYENYKYVFYFLQSIEQQLDKKGTGTTFRAISGETIRTTEIPLPPLPEQLAIVSKIEELLSDLENGKQQLQTTQQILKIYRQSLLKAAFEGKLTSAGRTLRHAQGTAAPVVEPVETTGTKDGELPKGWKWVKVVAIGQISTGSTPSKQNSKFYSDAFPFYKPTDLEAGYNVRKASDNLSELGIKEARFLPIDSILVTCIGATIGKTGIIRRAGASNQQINAIIPSKEFNANFIYYQTIAPKFQEAIKDNAAATTLPILNKSKFQNLEMVTCSLEEQQLIVEELESKLTVCDKIEEAISQSLQQAETLKQSILKRAFEGRLV